MISLRLIAVLLLVVAGTASGQDKVSLKPAADWKGTTSDFHLPASWLGYFPNAKVGDFIEEEDRYGRRRNEVVAVEAEALVVARVVENRTATDGKMELRYRYKLTEAQKKPAPAKGKAKSKAKAKEPVYETIKIGDAEVKCLVVKSGTITTWSSPELPFDGIARTTLPDNDTRAVAFGRGR